MKRLLLLSFVTMSLFACNSDKNDAPTPAVDYKDPKVLSGALTVKSGTVVTGTMPVGTGAAGAPVLSASSNNQVLTAINGRYAVVAPELETGKFKGYYVKVAGADNYFKVEFPAKAGARKAKNVKHGLLRGNIPDSLILIKLPEGLNVDTFKLQYAVYDSSNVVSNVITAFIAVLKPAGGADGAAFAGTWENYRYKGPNSANWTYVIAADTGWTPFTCVNNVLTYDEKGTPTITRINRTLKDQAAFNTNGTFTYEYHDQYSYLNYDSSKCNSLKYVENDEQSLVFGGWSYVPATKQLILVADNDGKISADDFSVVINTIKEVTATKIVTQDEDGYISEMIKK
ncbi:hypothetical protein [Chitinophaga arvensicola]|uniref:Uncharacterized protein n=1 Tax=Chitinophaga arvensicola TaxID=29529 RepID=A0A1I0S543_9BACT|nr:hypothetical protein [Chitinophaga arvensicola]SEW49736.1 hypothetical protein SAMN04488122_3553 [Chitinophaga arvensicola]